MTQQQPPNCYRSRPAADGGLYLLMPRDEHLCQPLPAPVPVVLGVVSENGQQSTVSKPALPLSCSHIATTIEPLKPSREMTMSTADTYVRARIDTSTKERAADALEAMGLSISDAIRLLMLRIADERRMPFDVKAPNATTRKAIAELEAGKGKRFASVDDLMADLHADD